MFGKYVLERELAEGGMARVFSATLRGTDGFEKPLVVKVIKDEFSYDPEFVKRFVAEAKTTVALTHPNIVTVYELGSEGGTYFLAMEQVNGISLRELLASSGRLTPAEGAYVGAEICRALDYAHRKMNVVHRDITPRNVMIDDEGQVKLIDFGIAAISHLSGQAVLGTPGHMPPEQYTASAIGPEADLFAVATLLVELWSGTPPFRRATVEESRAAMNNVVPKPSEIDPALHSLDDSVMRALHLDPAARPTSAEELARPLRAFFAGTDSTEIGRSLAEKVRSARTDTPVETKTSIEPPPATRSSGGTKTFAAREEVVRVDPPSTRKLASIPPSPNTASARKPIRSRPLVGAVVLATALIGVTAWRLRGAHSHRVFLGTPDNPVTPGPVTSFEVEMPRAAPVPLPTPTPLPTSTSTALSLSPAPLTAAAPPSPITEGRAALTLMGDPGTRVAVDGVAKGLCPVKLTVPPGPHEVRFTFDATGESRGERVTARANEKLDVFADFASATPRIHTERH